VRVRTRCAEREHGRGWRHHHFSDETTDQTIIAIQHPPHSVHEVAITDTTVVPEFPTRLVGALVALIGLAAVMGRRTKFSH
jgi:hypothetical protein